MKAEDFSEDDVHKLFSDGLKRAIKHNGAKYTLADLEREALALGYSPKSSMLALEHKRLKGNQEKFDLDEYVPKFYATGILPRKFWGPALGEARLFPVNALSILVALGSVGKTSTVISIAAHIAAGKDWGLSELQKQKCLLFFVEEDQVELDRKFGAVTHDWKDEERQLAINGMRLVSLKDRDPRLTRSDGRTIVSTGLSDAIIKAAIEFDAKLIVCDHLQGVTAGDLNISDTAKMLAQEANRIVSETEAAVVFTAHTNKSQIDDDPIMLFAKQNYYDPIYHADCIQRMTFDEFSEQQLQRFA